MKSSKLWLRVSGILTFVFTLLVTVTLLANTFAGYIDDFFGLTTDGLTLKGSDYGEGSLRFEQEPMEQMKNAGYSEQRYIFIDEEKGEATITYKYWYAGTTDTFVCKYEIIDGVFTFPVQISAQVGGGGANFAGLYKTWTLNDDGTALKYVPEE